jgi:hypothetical protein
MARSTAVVRYDDVDAVTERSVVAGFLAGYTGSTRVATPPTCGCSLPGAPATGCDCSKSSVPIWSCSPATCKPTG